MRRSRHAPNPSGTTAPAPVVAAQTAIAIPLYSYPLNASSWAPVVAAKQANSNIPVIAVVNPNSGPGSALDSTYANAIAALRTAGIIIYGYVHTSYGSVSLSVLETQLQQWAKWYKPTGMFFDEMANTPGFEDYYSTMSAYAKSLGMKATMGNPGTDTLPSYIGTMDTIVIYESPGLPTSAFLNGWHASYNPSNFAFISSGVKTLNASDIKTLSANVGYVYVTDDVEPDPYNTLPSYLSAEVAALA